MKLKFRAWDKKRQEMLPVTALYWSDWWVSCTPVDGNDHDPLKYGERNSFSNEPTDRHILMQCIGFKDSKGVEAYVGDIIKYENPNYGYGDPNVKEYCYSSIPDIINLIGDNEILFNLLHGEIVGNIYQNSELLEA